MPALLRIFTEDGVNVFSIHLDEGVLPLDVSSILSRMAAAESVIAAVEVGLTAGRENLAVEGNLGYLPPGPEGPGRWPEGPGR